MVRKSVKSLFFPSKHKRLARIIKISSPSEFRKSIKELMKNGLTLTEKRALTLARNRATAQLGRENLSDKEREEFMIISNMSIPKITKPKKTKK